MDSSKAQIAVDKFAEGYNCAQAVAFAFSEECGLSPNLALKAACGFGGGMGRKQAVCGAVTGAILVLGLRQGCGAEEGLSKKICAECVRSAVEILQPML